MNISGHPLHPMLIPLPIACAIFALASDIVAAATSSGNWYFMGYVLTIGMWATGLLAAIPGLIDYFTRVPSHTEAKKEATIHLLLNLSIVGLYVASWLVKNTSAPPIPTAVSFILEVIGVGLLGVSGWFGWSLVYKHRMGVDEPVVRESGHREAA